MSILFLTNDLIFSSRVSAAALARGVELQLVGSAAAVVENASAQAVKLVIVDLGTPGLDVRALAVSLRQLTPSPPLIAYAPHVHESKLAAAVEAGCDQVLSRGQFNHHFEQILSRY